MIFKLKEEVAAQIPMVDVEQVNDAITEIGKVKLPERALFALHVIQRSLFDLRESPEVPIED